MLSSLLQGGFVRPRLSKHKTSELTFTRQGIYSCTVALALMAILPLAGVRDSKWSSWVLCAIATGLSYTSATAVTGMMGAAAACCDDVEDEADHRGKLARGKALGRFRSAVSATASTTEYTYRSRRAHTIVPFLGPTGPGDRTASGDRYVLDSRADDDVHDRCARAGNACVEHGRHGQGRSAEKGRQQVQMKGLYLLSWSRLNVIQIGRLGSRFQASPR